MENLGRASQLLMQSVRLGHIEKAKEYAAILAQNKAVVQISINAEHSSPELKENKDPEIKYRIAVYLEDENESSKVPIPVTITRKTNVKDVKHMFKEIHGFPLSVQRWIFGKKLLADDDVLHKKGVRSSKDCVYLYLASSADLREYPPQDQATGGSGDAEQAEAAYVTMHGPNHVVRGGQAETRRDGDNVEYIPMDGVRHAAGAGQTHPLGNVAPANLQLPAEAPQLTLQGPEGDNVYETLPASLPSVAPPPPPPKPQLRKGKIGWKCPTCTFINEPTRPGCEMCSTDRPEDYQLPANALDLISDKEKERLAREEVAWTLAQQVDEQQARSLSNYFEMCDKLENQSLIVNMEPFVCAVCFDDIDTGEGVILRDCLHWFCRDCLRGCVTNCEDAAVQCPFTDEVYSCEAVITDLEIKSLVSEEEYQKYLDRGLAQAEGAADNSFHCKTVNCKGWCIYEDTVNFFYCGLCKKQNCLTCKAVHEGQNCKQYQDELRVRAQNDKDAQETQRQMMELLAQGQAMKCPQCEVLIMKKDGCDWLVCTMCKTEICWVTKGRRWGPKGTGDTSGGCKCMVNRKKCHPRCQNCH